MTGGTPSKSRPEYFGGRIRWLVSGDVHQREIYDCEGRITDEGMQNSNAKWLPLNSVMIALNGQGKTRGTVALLRTKATCNQSLVSISPDEPEKLLPEFLYANLHGRYQEIRRITGDSGNDRRGLNMDLIRDIEIPIAPPNEQKRIVDILDEALEGIATAKANAEKNLHNARDLYNTFRESRFEPLAKRWPTKRLGELATFRNGVNFTKASRGESVPIVGVKDFRTNFFAPLDDLDTVRVDGKLPELDCLKENDILFVRSNGNVELIGRCLLVKGLLNKTTYSGFTIRARLTEEPSMARYVCHYLKTEIARRNLIDSGSGVNIKSLNQGALSDLDIPIPPPKEQASTISELENASERVEELTAIYAAKCAAIEELKNSLLHQAFTGNL